MSVALTDYFPPESELHKKPWLRQNFPSKYWTVLIVPKNTQANKMWKEKLTWSDMVSREACQTDKVKRFLILLYI